MLSASIRPAKYQQRVYSSALCFSSCFIDHFVPFYCLLIFLFSMFGYHSINICCCYLFGKIKFLHLLSSSIEMSQPRLCLYSRHVATVFERGNLGAEAKNILGSAACCILLCLQQCFYSLCLTKILLFLTSDSKVASCRVLCILEIGSGTDLMSAPLIQVGLDCAASYKFTKCMYVSVYVCTYTAIVIFLLGRRSSIKPKSPSFQVGLGRNFAGLFFTSSHKSHRSPIS